MRRYNSILITLLFFTLLTTAAIAQTGKIVGVVTDAETGEPIIGANIIVEGTSRGAASGLDGDYVMVAFPPGIYTLKFSAVGYAPFVVTEVIVSIDFTTTVNAQLTPQAITMEEVRIVYKRPAVDLGVTSKVERYSAEDLAMNVQCPPTPHYRPDYNTEEFSEWIPNGWMNVATQPLSTFSVDVDNAAYTVMRQSISDMVLPPTSSVRIEEYINYFDYSYDAPDEDIPFSLTVEQSTCPWNNDHGLLLVGLKGKEMEKEEAPPSNFVFLIDNSGSMNEPDKSPLLKAGMRLMTEELRPNDKVAIVTYASNAGLVLPSTPGDEKQTIFNSINSLRPGGSTAGAAGIILAYEIAKQNFIKEGNNRVILATDGDFNVGVSSVDGLEKLIEEKREDGIFLTVLGFGRGNLKDNKMETLADKGNGSYYYIDSILEAQKVLVNEFTGLFTIAKDVKLQLEFNPAYVESYRLIGYENRVMDEKDFDDDKKDAGEIGAGHTVTALYELIPPTGKEEAPYGDLRYQKRVLTKEAEESDEIITLKIRYKEPDGDKSKKLVLFGINDKKKFNKTSDNFRFAAAVAEYCLILRDSPEKGDANMARVINNAKNAIGEDPLGIKAEFIRLAGIANTLVKKEVPREIDE